MADNVVSFDSIHADAEMRRIRKGMAKHDCSMKTFVYIDNLERMLVALAVRVERLEGNVTADVESSF